MKIMDCRYRPNTVEWMNTFLNNPVYRDYVALTQFDKKPVQSLSACVEQLKRLGVVRAVIPGRDIESAVSTPSSNALIDDCVAAFPDMFIGVYGYDPGKGMDGFRSMKRALAEGRSAGAAIEPGMSRCPVDDPRYYPLYTLCCEYNVPVLITAGLSPNMPGVTIAETHPLRIDKVATDYPELRMLISHGGYPWVNETIAICSRHRNIFMDFSSAANRPFGELYIKVANESLTDRFVFSSMSPATEFEKSVASIHNCGLTAEALEKILYANALSLFSITAD